MDAEDEAEDAILFTFTSEFDENNDDENEDSYCEEDIIEALEKVKKDRKPLPVEQLADLYLQSVEQNRAKVIELLCDVLIKRFKQHRSKLIQAGFHQIIADSLRNLTNENTILKKALQLLLKFMDSNIKFEVEKTCFIEIIDKVISRQYNCPDDLEITKLIFDLIITEKTDTSSFEKLFCKIIELISVSNDIREKIETKFFDVVSLDKSVTPELFGKLIQLLLNPSYETQSKVPLLVTLHKLLNNNDSFVYSADDETIDAFVAIAKESFSSLYSSACPTSLDAQFFNMLISLIGKLKSEAPMYLDVNPRNSVFTEEATNSFGEKDLFPELHVNINGSADYTSDYKKCKCSSKCACETVCFCGCTNCQRPPIIEKEKLYRELVPTNNECDSGTKDGSAEHAYAQLKSPLSKIFDDEEQFERIIESVDTDSDLDYEWEEIDDGKKLEFSADFESGNLQSARRVGEYDYEFILSPDTGTSGNSQWFYFSLTGMLPKETYTFKVINMEKSRTLFK